MPTLPPEPQLQPHQHRQVAEGFGANTELYDRTRQPYPDGLVRRIVEASPGREFLDVGCGTGIAARQFQAAGCTVLGVEPDERMAEFARGSGVVVEGSTIEAWDPAGRRFDAVVAGTAWHWVDSVAGTTKAAQVLRPGGLLAVFWHAFELPQALAVALAETYARVLPDSPITMAGAKTGVALYQPMFDKAADGIRQVDGFGEPEQWRFDWERTYPRDEWLEQMRTHGVMNQQPADKVQQILDGAGAAIDDLGGSFTMPYATVAVTALRI